MHGVCFSVCIDAILVLGGDIWSVLIVQNVAYGLSHIPIAIYSMKQIEKLLECVRDAMTSTLKINVKKPVLTAMRYEL